MSYIQRNSFKYKKQNNASRGIDINRTDSKKFAF